MIIIIIIIIFHTSAACRWIYATLLFFCLHKISGITESRRRKYSDTFSSKST